MTSSVTRSMSGLPLLPDDEEAQCRRRSPPARAGGRWSRRTARSTAGPEMRWPARSRARSLHRRTRRSPARRPAWTPRRVTGPRDGSGAATRQPCKLGRLGQPARHRARVDDLHRLVLGGEAVHLLVHREEAPVERRAVPVPPRLVGHGDAAARSSGPRSAGRGQRSRRRRAGGDALAIEPRERVALELVEARGERGQYRGVERRQVRADDCPCAGPRRAGRARRAAPAAAARAPCECPARARPRRRGAAPRRRTATSVQSVGSTPRSTVTGARHCAMLVLTTRMTPRAVSSGRQPKLAREPVDDGRGAGRIAAAPRRPRAAPSRQRPSIKFASVTVGALPPRP